ncbi:hypothetical protein [Caballeronia sp. ATUFL_F2_KS42]|nr:hypothetical protein [Caballeronia sp. ATUFL_F2_KS42]
MTKLNNDEAYLLITEFIEAINAQDAQTLQAKFDGDKVGSGVRGS